MHPITPLPCDISALRRDIVTYITTRRRRFRITGTDIDDLAQSSLTKIFASIHTYQPERGSFDAWAFGIVRHVLCHHARDMTRYNARFSAYGHNIDEYETPDPSPEECVQRTQTMGEISNAVDHLKPQHWAVFTLHAIDDMPHADIGERFQMSEAATQKCYQRTRDKLAQCLDDELLIDMPLVMVSCQGKRSEPRHSRWGWIYHGGHYTSQIASLVAAGFLALSLKTLPQTMDYASSIVAMQHDKPAPVLPSETTMPQDKPLDKHESAPAPRVPVVRRTPKNTVGKPTPTTYSPSYNPPASPASYRRLGR